MQRLSESLPRAEVTGFDTGFFASSLACKHVLPEITCRAQIFGDVRNIDLSFLSQFDAFVLLAAISNDPMGNRFTHLTNEINRDAHLRILRAVSAMRNKRVVFASSCSMYGSGGGQVKSEQDELDPLTAYAKSKVEIEEYFSTLSPDENLYTSLRFATACGASDRVRLDLVLNDFVASALQTGEIEILSDGQSWRPLIAVSDMASAVEWGLTRSASNGGQYVALNVGSDEWNYQIHDLARHVAATIPSTKVSLNAANPSDPRSYKVSFAKFKAMAPDHQPKSVLPELITKLADSIEGTLASMGSSFRDSEFVRLKALDKLISSGYLDENLHWQKRVTEPVTQKARGASSS